MKKLLFILSLLLTTVSFTQKGFVENKGQVFDRNQQSVKQVDFYYNLNNTTLFFEKNKVVYSFVDVDDFDEKNFKGSAIELDSMKENLGAHFYRLDMIFEEANKNVKIEALGKQNSHVNFYMSQNNQVENVAIFNSIKYTNVYDNIDVIFYKNEVGIKYDIILKEGADLSDVKINYDGAKNLKIQDNNLIIETSFKTITENIPFSFINGDKSNEVEVRYQIDDQGLLVFKTDDNFNTLTIDPVMEWSTYLNGLAATTQALDYANTHLDANGNVILYGQVYSAAGNYPVISPGGSAYTATYNSSSDLYIAKFDATRSLVWSTYFGGSNSDNSYGSNVIATRGTTLHIVGERISSDAPFTNGGGFYVVPGDNNDAFWARFNINTGALNHLTGIGGVRKPSIEISSTGNVGIISHAYDFDAPYVVNRGGAYNQSVNGGYKDMFFMMFNTSFNQTWGTYLGGPSTQENFMFRFDNSNNIIFIGETNWITASNPTSELLVNRPGAYYSSTYGGNTDVMLGMFNTSGSLIWNTLYGGDDSDARRGAMGGYAKLLIEPSTQQLLMFWNTVSTNLITLDGGGGAYYKTVPTHPSFNAGGSFWNYAAYFARFSSGGALNHASYYYNSTDGDLIHDVTFGGCNKLYIVGRSDPATFTPITLPGGFNLASGGQTNLMQMDRSSLNAEWLSPLAVDNAYGPSIAGRTDNPRVYVASEGYGNSTTMVDPGGGAYYNASNINGTSSNFMIWQLHPSLPPTITGTTSICSGSSTTLTASGGQGAPYRWFTAATGGTPFFTGSVYNTPNLTSNTTYYVSSGTGTCESPRTQVDITVTTPTTVNNTTSTAGICETSTKSLTATPGGGTWAVVSGGGTISGTTYTPGGAFIGTSKTVRIRYTLPPSGPCPGSSDTVAFIVYQDPGTANNTTSTATICETSTKTLTSSGAAGGTWNIISGGGSISGSTYTPANITSNTSVTIRYTIAANGPCAGSTDDVTFTVEPERVANITSSGALMCVGDNRTLTGTPTGGTWSVTSGPANITGGNQLNTTGAGTVVVQYSYTNACGTITDNQNITVSSSVSPTITNSTAAMCVGDRRELTGTPGGGTWSIIGGPGSIGTNDTLIANASGTIQVRYYVTSSCGNGADTVSINVNPTPTPSITSSGADLCLTGVRALTGSPTGGAWNVSSGPGAIVGSNLTGTAVGTVQVTYSVTQLGCTGTTNQNITIVDTANADWINPDTVCESSGLINLVNYLQPWASTTGTWSGTGVSGTTFNPAGLSGTSVTIQYKAGTFPCEDSVEHTITIIEGANSNWTSPGSWCESSGLIDLDTLLNSGALNGGVWSGTGVTGSVFDPTGLSGTISIKYVVDNGFCSDSTTENITIQSSSFANAQNDIDSLVTGDSKNVNIYQNDAGDVNTIQIVRAPLEGTASVSGGILTYTSTLGYIGVDSIEYEICDAACQSVCDTAWVLLYIQNDLTIPNGLSPNGDGKNDVFEILGIERYPESHLQVFNRWGSLVYESKPYGNDWRGQNNTTSLLGNEVVEGTYFYILKLGDGIEPYNGYIELRK